MNLRRLGAIVLKELRQLRRDRLTFAMIVGIPILQLVLFGYAINMDVRNLHAAVLDQADSARSREVIAELGASQVLDFRYHLATAQQLDQLFAEGVISAALVIPGTSRRACNYATDRPCNWWWTVQIRWCRPPPANWPPTRCPAGLAPPVWRW